MMDSWQAIHSTYVNGSPTRDPDGQVAGGLRPGVASRHVTCDRISCGLSVLSSTKYLSSTSHDDCELLLIQTSFRNFPDVIPISTAEVIFGRLSSPPSKTRTGFAPRARS